MTRSQTLLHLEKELLELLDCRLDLAQFACSFHKLACRLLGVRAAELQPRRYHCNPVL